MGLIKHFAASPAAATTPRVGLQIPKSNFNLRFNLKSSPRSHWLSSSVAAVVRAVLIRVMEQPQISYLFQRDGEDDGHLTMVSACGGQAVKIWWPKERRNLCSPNYLPDRKVGPLKFSRFVGFWCTVGDN